MRALLALAIVAGITPAAAQTPLSLDGLLPTIQPSGITAHLSPFITVPPDANTPPLTRITHVQQLTDGSGRIFTSDIAGTIYRTGPTGGTATPYIDIAAQNVGLLVAPALSGPGLGGFAFHPNFGIDPTKPGFDTFYTTTNIANTGQPTTLGTNAGPYDIQIREWTALDPHANTFQGTSRVVMTIGGYSDQTSNASISFNTAAKSGSPDYGNLYIGSGDGSDNDVDHKSQNLAAPQGKIIRINPVAGPNGAPYSVPADNPFLNTPGALPEVWASGLRSPQTFSWDSVTGAMYINDLGEAAIEEVNLGTPGANYGWGQREGTYATGYAYGLGPDDYNIYPVPPGGPAYTDPIAQYDHTEGRALGSGFVYRGTAMPGLYGKYVMADIVNGRLFTFDPTATTNGQASLSELLLTQDGQPLNLDATYGYDNPWNDGKRLDARLQQTPDGELLLALKSNGEVYQLTQDIPEPATLSLLAPLLAYSAARRSPRKRSRVR